MNRRPAPFNERRELAIAASSLVRAEEMAALATCPRLMLYGKHSLIPRIEEATLTFQRLKSPTELPTDAGLVVIDEVDLAPDTEWILRGINVERVPTDQPIRWDKYGRAHFDDTDRWNLDRRDEKTEKLLAWVGANRHPQPRKRKG